MRTTLGRSGAGGGLGGRLIIAAVFAIIALVGYFGATQVNPTTNEKQHISMTVEQEIGLGRQGVAEVYQQYGNESSDANLTAQVKAVGAAVVKQSEASTSPYPFEFHLLGDTQTINAFALPGGQIFVTEGLARLLKTEGELAGVLSHEVVHVVGRHSAEQIARAQLAEGLTGAAVMATYDPNNPQSAGSAQVAELVSQMVNLRYGREDELEADRLGVKYMTEAGYDPHAMIGVMQTLQSTAEGAQPPEFMSTHPDPGHRIEEIQKTIATDYPNGLPPNLKP